MFLIRIQTNKRQRNIWNLIEILLKKQFKINKNNKMKIILVYPMIIGKQTILEIMIKPQILDIMIKK